MVTTFNINVEFTRPEILEILKKRGYKFEMVDIITTEIEYHNREVDKPVRVVKVLDAAGSVVMPTSFTINPECHPEAIFQEICKNKIKQFFNE